jgi:hypothetical protein
LEIPWRRTCGKNTTHRGRKYEEGPLVAAEYKRTKYNVGDRGIWRRNTEEAWARCGLQRHRRRKKKKKRRKFLDSLSNSPFLWKNSAALD